MYVDTQVRPQGEQVDAIAPTKLKLSQVVRECGYDAGTAHRSYNDCVLGRAYRKLTGRELGQDALGFKATNRLDLVFTEFAANAFGVPFEVALKAEQMCYFGRHSPEQIAAYLEAQGL